MRSCPEPDCPPPEPFAGECRSCGKEGHRSAECPDKPPMICNNCKEEGECPCTVFSPEIRLTISH